MSYKKSKKRAKALKDLSIAYRNLYETNWEGHKIMLLGLLDFEVQLIKDAQKSNKKIK